jgi:hypothetical protein
VAFFGHRLILDGFLLLHQSAAEKGGLRLCFEEKSCIPFR